MTQLITKTDIRRLMQLYNIGKAPLSLALGFGEITLTRYLEGQAPSKEYSDIIKQALLSPAFMRTKLEENKDKLSPVAYNKAHEATVQLEELFAVSDTMLNVISCLFAQLEEITPLMLQKLLYFVQGVSFAINKRAMFPEDCQAWVSGPVYPKVYSMFRDFTYNPINDVRFAVIRGREDKLCEDDLRVIDLAVNTFGQYSARALEKVSRAEEPWAFAREGREINGASQDVIPQEDIARYYTQMAEQYDFTTQEGLHRYIADKLIEATGADAVVVGVEEEFLAAKGMSHQTPSAYVDGDREPNEERQQSYRDTDALIARNAKGYKTIDEMLESMEL